MISVWKWAADVEVALYRNYPGNRDYRLGPAWQSFRDGAERQFVLSIPGLSLVVQVVRR